MLDLRTAAQIEAEEKIHLELFEAASQGDLEKIKRLIDEEGADPEWENPNKHQRTSLHAAVIAGRRQVVEYLVKEAQVDPKVADVAGKTPFDLAWENNEADLAAYFKKLRFETDGTTVQSELEFVKGSLRADSPELSRTLATMTTLCIDPESRHLALEAQLPQAMVSLFPVLITDNSPRARVTIFQLATLARIDELKATFLKLSAFKEAAIAFSKTSVQTRDNLLVPFFHLISRGRAVRKNICHENELLLDSLIPVLENSVESLQAAGITLIVSSFFPAAENRARAIQLAKEKLFDGIRSEDPLVRNDGLDCLMEAAAMEEVRPILVSLGVKEILDPFNKEVEAEGNFVASLIQALLSANDVSATTETGTEPTSPAVITRIIKALDIFATTAKTDIETTHGFEVDCRAILLAARSLATNESNLKELSKQNFVGKVISLLKNRKQDLFLPNLDQLEEACNLVWALSFDKSSKDQLVASGMIEFLHSLPLSHAGVQRGVQGALWNLEGRARPQASSGQQASQSTGQVMISYSWGQMERMRQLASRLKSQGFNVWIDFEQMEGSVLEKMAEAIEGSSVIVIGLSSTYKDSQACRTEAEYAYRLKKDIAFVVAEENYVPKGWLGALLGNQLWYSPWTKKFDAEVSVIAGFIQKKLSGKAQAGGSQEPEAPPEATSNLPVAAAPSQDLTEVTALLKNVLKKLDALSDKVVSMESSMNNQLSTFQTQLSDLDSRLEAIDAAKQKEKKRGFFR